MMNKLITMAMAAVFVLSLQGPGRAQKEVTPPPIPPLLEDQRPLEHPETKGAATQKRKEKKARVKSSKKHKKAKVKKLGGKKRHVAVKKRKRKASKKKRPAVTPKQAGPDEG